MSYEEMCLFFHKGKGKESLIDDSISIINPLICPFTFQTLKHLGLMTFEFTFGPYKSFEKLYPLEL
jgi:hypothetical protein